MRTRILIVGGVAAGATAAARARRISEEAGITLIERGPYISYANCGLPYFVSGDVPDRAKLLLQTPEGFNRRYRVKVHLHTEAVELNRAGKRVRVRGPDGERWLPYDKLILGQGGNPVTPPVPGVDLPHVVKLWTVPDMDRITSVPGARAADECGGGGRRLHRARDGGGVREAWPRDHGGGAIAEPHVGHGPRIRRGHRGRIEVHGVGVMTGVGVAAVLGPERAVQLSDGRRVSAELVLFSVGVRPELTLAKAAGLAIGPAGALEVDEHLRTSDPDVFAAVTWWR